MTKFMVVVSGLVVVEADDAWSAMRRVSQLKDWPTEGDIVLDELRPTGFLELSAMEELARKKAKQSAGGM